MATKGRIRMLLSFSCFLVLIGHSYSQRDKLLQGEELKDGDKLVSASHKFKLEFFTPSSMPKSSKRYIGVWYNKPKDRVILDSSPSTKAVWVANRNIPILDKSASLRIDSSDGNLKIFHNGENPIQISWVQGARNTSVTLLQTGNLVLHETHLDGSIKQVLWQSFDHLTDTLLPGMKLGINLQTGHQWFLQSWLTVDSPAEGSFTVVMDLNVTNQLIIWWQGIVDRTSGHLLNGQFESWNASGYNFSYTSNEREKYFSYSVNEDITSFPILQIGWDGSLSDDLGEFMTSCSVFNEYCASYDRMCNSGSSYFFSHTGLMSGGGIKFGESDNMTLDECRLKCFKNCSCVAYAATNKEDSTGCEIWSRGTTKFIESYDGNNREIYVEIKYPDGYERPRVCNSRSYYLVPKSGFMSGDGIKFRESDNMTLADCRQKCYKSCSCVAYAATNRANDTGCEIWSRGTMFKESNDDNNREIYVEVEFIPPVIAEKEEEKKKWWIARIGLVIAVAVALLVILLCSLSYLARRKYKGKEEKWWQSLIVVFLVPLLCYFCYLAGRKLIAEVQTIMNRRKLLRELGDEESSSDFNNGGQTKEKDQTTSHELKIFKFQTIAAATDNFSTSNKLGEGGFGPVYKGKLLDGREIAIKRLSRRSGQGIIEFKNEAKLIAKLQHTNLVKLVGCSLQGEERILVYEYMQNKSLDFFIFDSDRKKMLDWKKRFNIIEGIAQGLIYLHKYSRLRVIHRDLKASNILLDDQLNPKISDFGMARIFGVNESEANTNRVVGTYGYMSPEYAMSGIVSLKTDVFSFGVLVLETVSGKKNNSCYHSERPLNLVGYAWQLWKEGKGLELIDTTLDKSCCPNDQVLRCLHVGLLCVQDQAIDRPTISDVVSMLTNQTMLLPAPKQPAFFINVNSDEEEEVSEIKLENCSTNDVTISEMEAR